MSSVHGANKPRPQLVTNANDYQTINDQQHLVMLREILMNKPMDFKWEGLYYFIE